MKRTTPDQRTQRCPGFTSNQPSGDDEDHNNKQVSFNNPTMKQKSGKVKPLTPEEMEARLFLTLASKSEIENKGIPIKIGTPDPTNSVLPFEVMNKIFSFIPSFKAQSNFALTNRSNYLHFDIDQPLRRFPGLVGDLKRTRHGSQLARLELIKQFDDQIKSNGSYDNVLLTPLSPLSRLSIAIEMLVWVQNHTLVKEKPDCIKLAKNRLLTEFTSLKNNPVIKPDKLHYILMLAIRAVLPPEDENKPHRSLVFNMTIGSEIIHALKNNPPDNTVERVIFFEFLKAYPDDERNIDYLETEASRWPLEHLAVAMMFKSTPLVLDRLTELTPSERPAAVTKIIQAMLTTHHVETYSHYIENIVRICAMCFCTLSRELTSETHSLIISVLDLLSNCANGLPPKNCRQARCFTDGFNLGDLPNTDQIKDSLKENYTWNLNIDVFKGYVYRRMIDWIKVHPDPAISAKLASALNKSFNIAIPNAPD
jgi:hypothetical protein